MLVMSLQWNNRIRETLFAQKYQMDTIYSSLYGDSFLVYKELIITRSFYLHLYTEFKKKQLIKSALLILYI